MTTDALNTRFFECFGTSPEVRLFSPGRINLIGEHTDYNGGRVLPCALTMGTYFAARKRQDRKLRFFSENFKEAGIIERDLDAMDYDPNAGFSNYLTGVIPAYAALCGCTVPTGLDIYLNGDIPHASGLSSSASVEVGMALLLQTLFDFPGDPAMLAQIGRYAENHYVGVNCGIMDQFIIALGKREQALFLDTDSLEYESIPVRLGDAKIVIICTNKKRGLADSPYNQRFSECRSALAAIQKVRPIRSLGELDETAFAEVADAIPDPIWRRRAFHAVSENQRTIQAARLLSDGAIDAFGKLMNASHISLRDDYEVTGRELDTIAQTAWTVDGCIGARMTGAGFGGCAVAIVKNDAIPDFTHIVGEKYRGEIGYDADFYTAQIGDGAHLL